MEKPIIEIIFVNFFNQRNNINVSKYQFSFQKEPNIITNSGNYIIELPDEIFKYNKYKNVIWIKLFNEKSLVNCVNMVVYKGKNSAYIFRGITGKSFEIIFRKMKDLKIEINGETLDRLDSMDTIDRKRLVLINCNFTPININNFLYELHENTFSNCKFKSSSYQISIFSLEKNLSIVKPILENDPFLAMNELNSMHNLICQKSKEFEKYLDENDIKNYESFTGRLKNNDFGISVDSLEKLLKMNIPKNYLEEIFEKNNWVNLDLYYNILVLDSIFALDEAKLKNRGLLKRYFGLAKIFVKKLNKDKKLKIYQKIQILLNIFMLLHSVNNESEIDFLNIKYYLFSDAKEDSILFKVKEFFEKLIANITEESYIFPYLLCLNSGFGYYNNEPIYCFDMQNVKMIKVHLKELFPETLVFYNLTNTTTLAFHHYLGGGIAINEKKVIRDIFDIQELDYISPCSLSNADDIAMSIVLTLLHEYCGHKKFSSGFVKGHEVNNSPKKYVNDSNEIIELRQSKEINLNEKNCDFILSSNTIGKGDSGHFFELSFAKIEGVLVISYLNMFNDNGKLLDRPDLFYGKTSDILKNYAKLKYICREKKIPLNFQKETKIEEEIEEMEELSKSVIHKRERENDDFEINQEKEVKDSAFNKKAKRLELNYIKSENHKSGNDIHENEIITNEDHSEDLGSENQSSKYFRNVLTKVIKKFGFNLNESITEQIYEKLHRNDPNVSNEDRSDFYFILGRYAISD